MRVELIEGACLVSRPKGAPRCPRESTFWYWLQRELNDLSAASAGTFSKRWYRIRPHKRALTAMPFGLRQGRDRKRNVAVVDYYYAMRDVAKQYNDGLTVRLARVVLEAVCALYVSMEELNDSNYTRGVACIGR